MPPTGAPLTMIGGYGLDASKPVPLVPYLAMRVPLLHRGAIWGLRRSRWLTRLVSSLLVFPDPRQVTKELIDEVHRQVRAHEVGTSATRGQSGRAKAPRDADPARHGAR